MVRQRDIELVVISVNPFAMSSFCGRPKHRRTFHAAAHRLLLPTNITTAVPLAGIITHCNTRLSHYVFLVSHVRGRITIWSIPQNMRLHVWSSSHLSIITSRLTGTEIVPDVVVLTIIIILAIIIIVK